MHVLSRLSLGYAADRVARVVGWSPVARQVVISGVEGPSARLFEGLTGTVSSVEESAMVLEPDRKEQSERTGWSHLRLTARHTGWTPFSLYLRPIAVVVEAVYSDGRPGPVAIGMAAVLRGSDRATHG